jgi:hypothetical protein
VAASIMTMDLDGVGSIAASVVADMTSLVPTERPSQQMEKNSVVFLQQKLLLDKHAAFCYNDFIVNNKKKQMTKGEMLGKMLVIATNAHAGQFEKVWSLMMKTEDDYYNEAVEYLAEFYDVSIEQIIYAYQDEIEAYIKILKKVYGVE